VTTELAVEAIRKALRMAFPDEAVEIAEETVAGVIAAMRANWDPSFAVLGLTPRQLDATQDDQVFDEPEVLGYYTAHATHTRFRPKYHKFTPQLPMVRVEVPKAGERVIATRAGLVYPGDHKLYNLELVNDYVKDVADVLGLGIDEVSRAELITPARRDGMRFGAVSVYLFYTVDHSEEVPSCFALEAGMATGEPRTLYFSPGFERAILRPSSYTPTPFSKNTNHYTGQLELHKRIEGEVSSLHIGVFEGDPKRDQGLMPHVTIDVTFEKVPAPINAYPGLLTLQAAARVALIGDALGVNTDLGIAYPILRALADTLPWDRKPNA
jgi:hypothetical protein